MTVNSTTVAYLVTDDNVWDSAILGVVLGPRLHASTLAILRNEVGEARRIERINAVPQDDDDDDDIDSIEHRMAARLIKDYGFTWVETHYLLGE